jgi:hypothetical protein
LVACGFRGRKVLQLDVLELDFHGWSLMKLKGQASVDGAVFGVRVSHFHGADAVDFLNQVSSFGDDVQGVPAPLFEFLEGLGFIEVFDDFPGAIGGDLRLVAAVDQDAASSLFVEDASVNLPDGEVRLIALDRESFGVSDGAAILDAGVALVGEESEFCGELEVADFPVLEDEPIALLAGMSDAGGTCDGAILHIPESPIAFPTAKVLAVEKALRVGGGGCVRKESAQDAGGRQKQDGRIWVRHGSHAEWLLGKAV